VAGESELCESLPPLLYVKAPAPDRDPRLTDLLTRLKEQASYRTFRTPAELDRLVRDDLATLLSERFAGARPPVADPAPLPAGSATWRGPRPLPGGTTSLFGREQAIDEGGGLVGRAGARPVTPTGPGGGGQTPRGGAA